MHRCGSYKRMDDVGGIKMKMSIVATILVIASISHSGAAAEYSPLSFKFPGPTRSVSSDSHLLVARYEDPGLNEDGIHEYRFSITNSSGNELVKHIFTRYINGTWCKDRDELYMNDFVGSNFADCFVTRQVDAKMVLESLSHELINDPKSGPVGVPGIKPPETPHNSNYYLNCEQWVTPDILNVVLEGTTEAGGDFKYKLQYNTEKRQFTLAQ
jgi:hypothetical protein